MQPGMGASPKMPMVGQVKQPGFMPQSTLPDSMFQRAGSPAVVPPPTMGGYPGAQMGGPSMQGLGGPAVVPPPGMGEPMGSPMGNQGLLGKANMGTPGMPGFLGAPASVD